MDTPFDFQSGEERLVYVKPIRVSDLPDDVQAQAEGREKLFSVHDAQGQQLALVADEKLAMALARQHNYAPLRVH